MQIEKPIEKGQKSIVKTKISQNIENPQKSPRKSEQIEVFCLRKVNLSHLSSCILQEQIINYNRNTMKIDKQIPLLTSIIIKQEASTKPKDFLKKLSQYLDQDENFIYSGLSKKINKRAIKKYFDNCVAEVRNKLLSSPYLLLSISSSNPQNGMPIKNQTNNKENLKNKTKIQQIQTMGHNQVQNMITPSSSSNNLTHPFINAMNNNTKKNIQKNKKYSLTISIPNSSNEDKYSPDMSVQQYSK